MINKSTIKSIITCVPPKHKRKLLPLSVYSIGNVLLDLISIAYLLPFFMVVVDKNVAFENRYLQYLFQKEHLVFSLVLLIAFFIAKNLLSIFVIRYQNDLAFDISSEISRLYTQKFIRSNYLSYQNQDKGEIIKNTIEVPNNFSANVLLSLNTIISESIIITLISTTGLFLFPKITLVAILTFLLAFAFIYSLRKLKLKNVRKSLSSDYRNNVNFLMDLINGFFEIKSTSKEDAFLEKFNTSNKKLNKTHAFLSTVKNANAKFIEIIIICIISLLIVYLNNYSGESSKNVLLISFMASGFFKLIPSLNKLIIAVSSVKSYGYTIDVILKYCQNTNEDFQDSGQIRFKDALVVENISFNYAKEHELIKDICFQLEKGTIMGISGRSGTGKTTLLHIILKLIEPNTGKIMLDGTEITQQNKNEFLKLIGYVTQEPYVFNGTILENIAIGETMENIDFDRIDNLIKVIGFEEVLQNHPDGLHTITGNNGQKLSGGQKQKLAIIRALYNNPEILILDEATNQLDEENELSILNHIKNLSEKERLTIILISHNKKALDFCDTVYQFQKNVFYEV